MFEKRVAVVENTANDKNKKANENVRKSIFDKENKASKGKETRQGASGTGSVKAIVIPLVLAAIVVCLIFITVQKNAESKIVEKKVVCATVDIKENTYIAKDKIENYFKEVSVDASLIPSNAVTSISDLPAGGFYVDDVVSEKQMVMNRSITESSEVMSKYTAGTTTTSFAVSSLENSISGTVRSGDIVDIYALNPATESMELMVSKVYVKAAYDNAGEKFLDGMTGVATNFTVMVAPNEVEKMNSAIAYGGIQLYMMGK